MVIKIFTPCLSVCIQEIRVATVVSLLPYSAKANKLSIIKLTYLFFKTENLFMALSLGQHTLKRIPKPLNRKPTFGSLSKLPSVLHIIQNHSLHLYRALHLPPSLSAFQSLILRPCSQCFSMCFSLSDHCEKLSQIPHRHDCSTFSNSLLHCTTNSSWIKAHRWKARRCCMN